MVEAMMAITLVDAIMMQAAQCDIVPRDEEADEQHSKPNPMGTTAFREGGPAQFSTAVEGSGPVSQRIDEE